MPAMRSTVASEQGDVRTCGACRRAKRKCSKERPRCNRCREKSLHCVYHAQSGFIMYTGDANGSASSIVGKSRRLNQPAPEHEQLETQTPERSLVAPRPIHLQSAWFLTPDSWNISPINLAHLVPVSTSVLKGYINKTQEWLKTWVTEGANPFIHSQIYHQRMPPCIQDAFTTLSAYLSKTAATEELIFRIVEDRAQQLVQSQAEQHVPRDIIHHISRVHSLLTYTVLQLFDGDIRQRFIGEQHMAILSSWNREMLDQGSQSAKNGTLLDPSCLGWLRDPSQDSQQRLLWQAWIISETIRRTWVVSETVRIIYNMLQKGASDCPGGIKVTTRKDVWGASSPYEWVKICAEKNVSFIHRNDSATLFVKSSKTDVDDFNLALMELDFGVDMMNRWSANSNP